MPDPMTAEALYNLVSQWPVEAKPENIDIRYRKETPDDYGRHVFRHTIDGIDFDDAHAGCTTTDCVRWME